MGLVPSHTPEFSIFFLLTFFGMFRMLNRVYGLNFGSFFGKAGVAVWLSVRLEFIFVK